MLMKPKCLLLPTTRPDLGSQ